MTLAIAGLVIGAILGALIAWRRKGNRLDIAQYAAVYAILLAVAGMIVAIGLARLFS